ncbi:MAG: RNA polymerase subunit sigma [Bacteroidetes bacterium MED-G17]|nr:MAG: RNA polymerase subunit sigma [Bacteroidetes bacterium TMED39]PDH52369.1 MAG: RNA polymerase subunit sigma [Bacteroidetes bacterium MED-G17]CAI8258453.1 MAG: ECF RNA polymerase sigma factor SigR [Bacteroidetes bacterium MED-G17]|tara:strand:+ start:5905 stop:6435 length:531 start_codon:yes stop_codon:yes gene_type:complete
MTSVDFDKQVQQQERPLMNYALQLTKDFEDAKDLVQETMLKAFTYKSKFKEGTNLKGWLYTIMKNSFINNYRRIVKRNTFIDTTDSTYHMDIEGYYTENKGTNNFLRRDMEYAIEQLPEDLQVTFNYNRQGFKYHEIADILNIPIGTVKTRIFVAKRKLRKHLRSYAHDYGLKEKN